MEDIPLLTDSDSDNELAAAAEYHKQHIEDTLKLSMAYECRREGNRQFSAKNFKKSIECYEKGLEICPNDPFLHSNKAQAHLKLNDFHAAENSALKAIYLKPDFPKAYYRGAVALEKQVKLEESVKLLYNGLKYCTNTMDLKELLNQLYEKYPADLRSMKPHYDHATSHLKKRKFPDLSRFHVEKTCYNDVPELCSSGSDAEAPPSTQREPLKEKRKIPDVENDMILQAAEQIKMEQKMAGRKESKDREKKMRIQKEDKERHKKEEQLKKRMKETDSPRKVENSFTEKQQEIEKFQTLLKEGSEALLDGLARAAVVKYQIALDMVTHKLPLKDVNMKKEDLVVLKYALAVACIYR